MNTIAGPATAQDILDALADIIHDEKDILSDFEEEYAWYSSVVTDQKVRVELFEEIHTTLSRLVD